jgi:putative transposase
MIDSKDSQFEREIILWGVRWYVAYPISYRQLEEMMGERGVAVDHSTLNRWVIKYTPEFEKQFRRRQCPVGVVVQFEMKKSFSGQRKACNLFLFVAC